VDIENASAPLARHIDGYKSQIPGERDEIDVMRRKQWFESRCSTCCVDVDSVDANIASTVERFRCRTVGRDEHDLSRA
jgi:hypothetical protein